MKSVSKWLWSEFKVAIDFTEDLYIRVKRKETIMSAEEYLYDKIWKGLEDEIFIKKHTELQ